MASDGTSEFSLFFCKYWSCCVICNSSDNLHRAWGSEKKTWVNVNALSTHVRHPASSPSPRLQNYRRWCLVFISKTACKPCWDCSWTVGIPLPEHCQTKSASALSRFLNEYNWSTRKVVRTVRKAALQILSQSRLGRRPRLQVILDLTTLEKEGKFQKFKHLMGLQR